MSERDDGKRILAILRGELDAVEPPRDAEAFVALCRQCEIAPTIHALLERAGRFDRVGAEVERRLGEVRHKCRNDNLLLLARLEQALDLLRAEGILPVALKGTSFLARFYPSFDERTLDDVDLLVAPDQAPRAIGALERAGWTGPTGEARTHWLRSSFEMPLTSPGPVTVLLEIHWSLGQERRYAVPIEAVLARAVPQEIAGRPARRLDDHDAAAHLLLHHVQHYFDRRLKWAYDLRSLARTDGFSWEDVAGRAHAWGGLAAASMALAHLRRLFPGEFPDWPVAAWRRALTLPLRVRHPLDFYRATRRRWVQLWIASAALENPGDLLGYARHRSTRDEDPTIAP